MSKMKVEPIRPTTTLEFARAYARRGWLVLPIWPIKANGRCACQNPDCDRPGKHPAVDHGVKDASADLTQIEEWWASNPKFGVAIATGKASGLTGLDIDVKDGKQGDITLDRLRGREAMPEALCVETPTHGRHYYFTYNRSVKTAKEPFGKDTAIDTRNDNGYLIAPPSPHVAGGTYKWLTANWIKQDLPDWPDWLRKGASEGDEGNGKKRGKEKFDPRDKRAVATLKHALGFVDFSDYDKWLKVGFIFGRAFQWSDEGYQIYSEWAAQAGSAYDHRKTYGIYYKDSKNPPTKSLTTASIFQWAGENPEYTPLQTDVERQFTIVDDRTDVPAVADELADIAAHSASIYKRNGDLVFMASPNLTISRHTPKTLQLELSRHVSYLTPGDNGLRSGPVPEAMAAMVLERRAANARPLLGISRFPIFRADWSVAADAGYDPETGVYIDLPEPIRIVPRSFSTLRELVSDFPWASPLDEAVFFAALFTVGLRHLFPTAPLFGFSAYAAGSGKSLLCDVISMLWYGRRASKSFWPEKEEEMGKTLVAHLLGGGSMIVFDNIDRGEKVHDATLCAMLSSESIKLRILGKSEMVDMDTHVTVFATGNDLTFTGDTARRAMLCTIDVPSDSPESRTGFKHEDLLGYIKENRAQLLGCALGAVQDWAEDGAKTGMYTKGGFEIWGKVISGILQKNGLPHIHTYKELAIGQVDESAEAEIALLSVLAPMIFTEADSAYTTVEITQKILNNSELRDVFKTAYPLIVNSEYRKARVFAAPFEINVTTVGKALMAMNGRWRIVETVETKPNKPSVKPSEKAPLYNETLRSHVMRMVLELNRKTKQRKWKLEEKLV